MRGSTFSLGLALASLTIASPALAAVDWSGVDATLGRQGAAQADGVHRYSFPRSDLKVRLDGVEIKPALALGSWLAFRPMGEQAMVMGDLVLTEEEVNPVLSRLLAGGLTITALHNHLLRSHPATMYMHVSGHGDPAVLARTLRAALEATRTPLAPPTAAAPPVAPAPDFDRAAVEKLLGASAKQNGGVYQFSFPRAEALTDGGMPAPATMGTATGINFQPTGSGKAAITGDFVMIASEVDPVLRALRGAGIEVTALHNHMLQDEPRLFFMHFWANADAQALAKGLRSALDGMNLKR